MLIPLLYLTPSTQPAQFNIINFSDVWQLGNSGFWAMIKKTKVSHNYISIAQKPCRGCRREESQDTLNQHSSLDTCIQVKGSRGLSWQDSKVGRMLITWGGGSWWGNSCLCPVQHAHCIAQCALHSALHKMQCTRASALLTVTSCPFVTLPWIIFLASQVALHFTPVSQSLADTEFP